MRIISLFLVMCFLCPSSWGHNNNPRQTTGQNPQNNNHEHSGPDCRDPSHIVSATAENATSMGMCLGIGQAVWRIPRIDVRTGRIIQEDPLTGDQGICQCFRGDASLVDSFNAAYTRRSSSNERNVPEANLAQLESNMTGSNHLLLVDASFMISGVSGLALNQAVAYFASTEADSAATRQARNETFTNLRPLLSAEGSNVSEARLNDIVNIKQIDKRPLEDVPQPLTSRQCFSYRSFIKWKQIPEENDFYIGLANLTEYRPEDWNYENLKVQLRAAHRKSNQELIKIIESRIRFLHYNTVFKNLFSSPVPEEPEAKKDLEHHQNELFKVIRKNLNIPNAHIACPAGRIGCRESLGQNVHDRLKQESHAVLTSEDGHGEEGHAQNYIVDSAKQNNLQAMGNKLALITAPNPPDRDAVLNESRRISTLGCDQSGYDRDSCVEAWGAHCHSLEQINLPPDPADALEAELMASSNIELDDNQDYQKFIADKCQRPRIPIQGGGPAVSFEQYRSNLCGSRTTETCAPEKIPEMVAQYLSQFTVYGEVPLGDRSITNPRPYSAASVSEFRQQFEEFQRTPIGLQRRQRLASSFAPQTTEPAGASRGSSGNAGTHTSSSIFPQGSSQVPSFLPPMESATVLPPLEQQIQQQTRETARINRTISEKTQELASAQSSGDDERTRRLEEQLASLRNDLQRSNERYTSFLEQLNRERSRNDRSPASERTPSQASTDNRTERPQFVDEGPAPGQRMADSVFRSQATGESNVARAATSAPASGVDLPSASVRTSATSVGQINNALLDANNRRTEAAATAQNTQLVATEGNRESVNQVPVTVPREIYTLVQNNNPEAIRQYALEQLQGMNTDSNEIYLQVNLSGSTIDRPLELIAFKQPNGQFSFYTPEAYRQMQSNRSRAPAGRVNRLEHLNGAIQDSVGR